MDKGTTLASIMAKITKLLAITEDRGATTAEAATAAAKVQALLFAHNLSLADVHEAPRATGPTLHTHDCTGPQMSWPGRHELMHIIATHHFCTAVADLKDHRHLVIGKPHNVAVCVYVHTSVSQQIHRLAYAETRRVMHGGWWSVFYRGFWRGACETIHQRLAQQSATQTATARGNALVVQSRAELEAVKHRLLITTSKACRKALFGVAEGRKAGKDIRLSAGIETSTQTTKTLGAP